MPDAILPDGVTTERPPPALEDGLRSAQEAQSAGDLPVALAIWSDLRTAFPDSVLPFQRAAAALLENYHFDESEVLLEAAMERFPGEPGLAIDHAWVAHRRRDLPEAIRRWDRVREAFPDHPVGYTGAVVTLRDLGQLRRAEALLTVARERFPADPAPLIELAWMAQARHDWPEAIERWEVVRDEFPDLWQGYTGGAAALRDTQRFDEAEALLAGAMARFPFEAGPLIEHAWIASARHDWPESLRRWEIARERFPDKVEAYTGQAIALRESGQQDAADAVLSQAIARFPGNPHLLIDHAWLAHHRRDWPAAIARWEQVRQLLPEHREGFTSGAAALREANRFTEAEAVLADARLRFPDALEPALEYAALAQSRRDWGEANARWDDVCAHFPDYAAACLGAARCRQEQGDSAAAEAILRRAVERFPDQSEPSIGLASLTTNQHRYDEASALWQGIRERFPAELIGFVGGVTTLREAGRLADAELLLGQTLTLFPHESRPLIERGWLALAQRAFTASAGHFSRARDRFPTEPAADLGLARALVELGRFDEADTLLKGSVERFPWFDLLASDLATLPDRRATWQPSAEEVPEAEPADTNQGASHEGVMEPHRSALHAAPRPEPNRIDPKLRDFVARFESLGGTTHGHELGLVQRACGADPLSLLRWADIGVEALIAALEQSFQAVGDPDATELVVLPTDDGQREYCTRDARGMMIRTFINEADVPFEQMATTACRRLRFLARMQVERLKQGDRIFVFRTEGRLLTEAEVARLYAAVRAYGDNTLLIVGDEDANHPAGSVTSTLPGLLLGRIDRFSASGEGSDGEPPVEHWLMLLGNAAALWQPPVPRPEAEAPEEPAPAAPLSAPTLAQAPAIKVAVMGYHLASQVATIFARLPVLRGKISVQRLDAGSDVSGIRTRLPDRWLDTADIYFEEAMVGSAEVKQGIRSFLPSRCEISTFPTPTMGALWPFRGRDDRLVPEPPIYNGGRYNNTDPIAASLADLGMTDDALFDAYMEMTEAAPLDLDAMLASDLARWEADDSKCDVRLAAFMHANFRTERLFTTPYERGTEVLRQIVTQLFETPLLRDGFDTATLHVSLVRLTLGWQASHHELPVHPRVARHFGLSWWAPDMRYRMMENRFTFRDYTLRYIHWSPWLA